MAHLQRLEKCTEEFVRASELYLKDLVLEYAHLFNNPSSLQNLSILQEYYGALQQKMDEKSSIIQMAYQDLPSVNLDNTSLNSCEKSHFLSLKAKSLNVMADAGLEIDEEDIMRHLEKSLELDSTNSNAHCELGEALWRSGDLQKAVKSFEKAIELDPMNGQAHWKLSMALRHLQSNEVAFKETFFSTESVKQSNIVKTIESKRAKILTQSLQLARKAVELTPEDPRSWECLGNALATLSGRLRGSSVKAKEYPSEMLNAYNKAMEAQTDSATFYDPNFHYCRSMAYSFDDASLTIRACFMSTLLDPYWDTPLNRAKNLIDLIFRIHNALTKPNNGIRRLINCIQFSICRHILSPESEAKPEARESLSKLMTRILGPLDVTNCTFSNLATTEPKTKTATLMLSASYNNEMLPKTPLKLIKFSDLQVGPNEGTVLIGRVLQSVIPNFDGDLALNCVLADPFGSIFHLRILKVGKNCGPRNNDFIAIHDPEMCFVKLDEMIFRNFLSLSEVTYPYSGIMLTGSFQDRKQEISFPSIIIRCPESLILNGRPIGSDWNASIVVENIFFT